MLAEGSVAPGFSIPDQDGNTVTLDELRGHWVLLWWYPKASTPG
jgi:peroxiredoxin Q/BCP